MEEDRCKSRLLNTGGIICVCFLKILAFTLFFIVLFQPLWFKNSSLHPNVTLRRGLWDEVCVEEKLTEEEKCHDLGSTDKGAMEFKAKYGEQVKTIFPDHKSIDTLKVLLLILSATLFVDIGVTLLKLYNCKSLDDKQIQILVIALPSTIIFCLFVAFIYTCTQTYLNSFPEHKVSFSFYLFLASGIIYLLGIVGDAVLVSVKYRKQYSAVPRNAIAK